MKYTLYILALFTLLTCKVQAQSADMEWISTIGGAGTEMGNYVAVDGDGNTYLVGHYRDTVDFDPGEGVNELISQGNEDLFVVKLNADGEYVWAISLGGISSEYPKEIKVDNSGNIFVIGTGDQTIDFDPGEGEHLVSMTGMVYFILKLNGAGEFVFVNTYETIVQGLWFDQMGQVYMSIGNSCRLQKLNQEWEIMWERTFTDSQNSQIKGITTDFEGNVYTTGFFSGTVDFHPGDSAITQTSNGGKDAFIHKMDADGNFLWVKFLRGTFDITGFFIACDPEGFVYASGVFDNSGFIHMDPEYYYLNSGGSPNVYLIKFDSDGYGLWGKQWGSAEDIEVNIALHVDNFSDVYIGGTYRAEMDLDYGPGECLVESNGLRDVFIIKIAPDGDFIWGKSVGGTGSEYFSHMTMDNMNNVYIGGTFEETADFDPGSSNSNTSSNGNFDAYVVKLAYSECTETSVNATTTFGTNNLLNSLIAGNTNASYLWMDCSDSSIVEGEIERIFTWETDGVYAVIVSEGGCIDTSDCVSAITNTTGMDTHFSKSISIYPNPGSGSVYIDLGELTNVYIEVLDIQGRIITRQNSLESRYLLEIPGPAGVYIIQLRTASGEELRYKYVKE